MVFFAPSSLVALFAGYNQSSFSNPHEKSSPSKSLNTLFAKINRYTRGPSITGGKYLCSVIDWQDPFF